MSFKSSPAAKALVVALLVCSGASVTRAQAIHDSVARNSDAFDTANTVNTAHAPVSYERHLRSSVTMTTDDATKAFGERETPSRTASFLGRRLPVAPLEFHELKTDLDVEMGSTNSLQTYFERLEEVLNRPGFEHYDITYKRATIFDDIKSRLIMRDSLTKFLAEDHPLAKEFRRLQMKEWANEPISMKKAFKCLSLDKKSLEDLFKGTQMDTWGLFGEELNGGRPGLYEKLFQFLTKRSILGRHAKISPTELFLQARKSVDDANEAMKSLTENAKAMKLKSEKAFSDEALYEKALSEKAQSEEALKKAEKTIKDTVAFNLLELKDKYSDWMSRGLTKKDVMTELKREDVDDVMVKVTAANYGLFLKDNREAAKQKTST